MKKTILTIAMLTAALGAQATSVSPAVAPLAVANAAIAAGASAAAAGAAAAAPAAATAVAAAAVAAPAAATAAAAEQATVSVTGASTIAGAPLLLSLNGAKPVDPSFNVLFEAGQANPTWKVTKVTAAGEKSRMFLKSTSGRATLELDVATSLVAGLKIQKDTRISVETQSSGKGALIKFMKDKTPLGFMVNNTTKVR